MVLKIENSKKAVQSLQFLKITLFIRLIFGGYYNISSSKLISFFIKSYCIAVTVIVTINCIVGTIYSWEFLFTLLAFNCNTIWSIFSAEDFFFKYCERLKTSDAVMGIKNASLISKDVIFITVFVVSSRLCLGIYFIFAAITTNSSAIINSYICLSFSVISVDMHFVTMVTLFALLHNRMKRLRKSLENTYITVNIVQKYEVATQINQIRRCVRYYNNLLDNLLHIDNEVQIVIFLALACALPQLIMQIYVAVKFYLLGINTDYIPIKILDIFLTFARVCSPAIIAEMTIKEVEKIRTTLATHLRRCQDESLRFELAIALNYVTHRPFYFTIWRAFSLDISMLVGIVTLTITYVIVTTQIMNIHF